MGSGQTVLLLKVAEPYEVKSMDWVFCDRVQLREMKSLDGGADCTRVWIYSLPWDVSSSLSKITCCCSLKHPSHKLMF